MIWADRVFTPGQRIRAVCNANFVITGGKEYVVHEYRPRVHDDWFAYPDYVTVTGDHGDLCTLHAYRFTAIEETNQPEEQS